MRSKRAPCGSAPRIGDALPDGVLRSLIVDGLFAGVGAVIVFLPQILILFLFILVLESTGYMVRAAFLMDRLMSHAGLSGRAFIPLLSSFACAVPGDHGDAHDRGSQGPADDDPRRAADDLLGAPAGLHADHRRLHPGAQRAARGRAPGPGPVRPLRHRRRRRAARRDRHPPHGGEGRRRGVHDGIAQIPDAAPARRRHRAVAARRDLPQARRRDHPRHHAHPVGAGELPRRRARARNSPTSRSPARSATPSTSSSRRSGSTRTSASRCSRRWRRARSRSRRSPRSIRSTPPTTRACRRCRSASPAAGASPPRSPSSPGSCSPRNASRPSPSRGAKPTAGNGPLSWSAYLFVLAYLAAGATYWTAVAFGLG